MVMKSGIFTKLFKNAKEFPNAKLSITRGTIPKQISGHYFRNCAGKLNYNSQVSPHWFMSDGFITKIKLKNGECQAQAQYVKTHIRKERQEKQKFDLGALRKFQTMRDRDLINISNTSVHLLKNSENFLSLCEAGKPFLISKQNLKNFGFKDYGWMQAPFSAHPKIDPDNQDIFNFGVTPPNSLHITQSNSKMEKIASTKFELRSYQSIHDFCLAGDYIIVLESSMAFSALKALTKESVMNAISFDKNLPCLLHIFSKKDLKFIKTINMPSFYAFHFTNGFSDDKKITFQFVKYDADSSQNLFKFLQDIPKYTQGIGKQFYEGHATLNELTIDIKTFEYQQKSVPINGEFPVCDEQVVGKKWRQTYLVGSSNQNKLAQYDRIYKYDRETEQMKFFQEDNAYFNEPTIIKCGEKKYLMTIVCKYLEQKNEIYLLDAENLTQVCAISMPQYMPPAFHGKWESL